MSPTDEMWSRDEIQYIARTEALSTLGNFFTSFQHLQDDVSKLMKDVGFIKGKLEGENAIEVKHARESQFKFTRWHGVLVALIMILVGFPGWYVLLAK